ncbi:right-handed parallel beta-helix repeat-containing protein [Cognatishimia sp. F0-27]|uniref:right-handed parallel beta-helix repeat-containing protein n=1 Tax=Cognatishimia sp. F0-27 TaxID=2816855 RepID=UPI001D0CCB32|nr:right-handed parallel beta-helix repeat-containing protein [Cognatishimia sp. F0-27]MCC1494902.1 right-handed parallel beta-helix repeat-containing protein [Cognatishimia sp. F0-27]
MRQAVADKRRFAARLIGALAGALMAVGMPAVSADEAAPGDNPRAQLFAFQQALRGLSEELETRPQARFTPIETLRKRLGVEAALPAAAQAIPPIALHRPRTQEQTAQARIVNFRLALAVLSQTYGGKDNLDVLMAQPGGRTDAVSFRGGHVTLADILRESARIAPPGQGEGVATLRVPVILWDDTVLRLGPQDRLALSRPDGAFLISLGRVEITGSVLSVGGDANLASPDFVPFITVAGGGSLSMRGALVNGLGFGKTAKFAGLSVAANPLMRNTGQTRIEASHFTDVNSVAVIGKAGALVRGNSFAAMRDAALWFESAGYARIEENLFYGPAPTNAIRLLNGSRDAVVMNNILLGGDRAGILVDTRSDNARVSGNIVWNRDGGGIKFSRVHCSVARGNLVIDSRQKGIEIRRSRDSFVLGNLIGGNRNSGVWISRQDRTAQTFLRGNTLLANKAGLTMTSGGAVHLDGNDFRAQLPQVLSGDVALHSRALIGDLTGAAALVLKGSGSAAPEADVVHGCTMGEGF